MINTLPQFFEVEILKLVHGGQGIANLPDGRKVFVWGVLPGEVAKVKVIKSKKDYVEATVVEILKTSKNRMSPKDEAYLSTSPWQIIDYGFENKLKSEILTETYQREKLAYNQKITFEYTDQEWGYRNKMEYSFFGDEQGLHLALYNRGTNKKQIIHGSSIANQVIDLVANKILKVLDKNQIRAGDLKSMILRCNEKDEVVCAIFTKKLDFKKLTQLKDLCKGVVVVYSNPKSPASIITSELYKFGDITLQSKIMGKYIKYDVFSFFQVNLGIFELSLKDIRSVIGKHNVVDLYSGVGTIGLSMEQPKTLVDIDSNNAKYAKINAINDSTVNVILAPSEKALDSINNDDYLILDPPRAGLHNDLITKILEQKPPKIAYLSCNPSTHARDLKLLEQNYIVVSLTGYNFFPKTPHIESLAVLSLK